MFCFAGFLPSRIEAAARGVTHESLYLGLHSIVHESRLRRGGRRITLSGPSKGRGSSPRVPMAIIVTSTSP